MPLTKTTSKLHQNKYEDDKEGVEALLQLRRQWSRDIDELELLRIPQHLIIRASVRISVGYNILQLK